MNDFLDLMSRRFACKKFITGKKLSDEQIEYILEIGRLSPTSFGLEAWKFIAVSSPDLIVSLGRVCGDQDAVRTAPLVLAILFPTESAFALESPILRARAERFPGGWEVFREDYRGYYDFLRRERRLEHWARSQTYIACANMITGAAAAGLASCAIEGFDEAGVLDILGKTGQGWRVGIMASFGFADEKCRPKIREPLGAVSEILA